MERRQIHGKDYFQALNQQLKEYKNAVPRLLIDLDALDRNIEEIQRSLKVGVDFRIVVKSLPSPRLIEYLQKKLSTARLMAFHQPILTQLMPLLDHKADVLLGKPMPLQTLQYFYENLPADSSAFDPFVQVQWLVDTTDRLKQYREVAQLKGWKIKVNLEVDVGLHRGGFADAASFERALDFLEEYQGELTFAGLMGYDPHIVKLPRLLRSQQKAFELVCETYQTYLDIIKNKYPTLWHDQLTFNGAGSPTITLHQSPLSPLNDWSAGSCLVKPSGFDRPSLAAFQPACYIATPVLKKMKGTTLPALEGYKGILNAMDASNQQSFFIYGGYWKADYHYPFGLRANRFFGASTNQSMLNAPPSCNLDVDDFVFLRPRQSEFVVLQFGKILAIRNRKIVGEWDTFKTDNT